MARSVVEAWPKKHEPPLEPARRVTAKRAKTAKATVARFDETTAQRIRELFADRSDVEEKKMFGGLCFMVAGHMCCGLTKTDLMVRVGPEAYDDALAQPHARPMDFTGRPLVGFVYVHPAGYRTLAGLRKWVGRGVRFVSTQPAPKPKPKRVRK